MTNLFNQKEFFESLKAKQLIRSYFNPEKIFEVKEGERENKNGEKEKLIEATNFEKREYWITEIDCNAKSIML